MPDDQNKPPEPPSFVQATDEALQCVACDVTEPVGRLRLLLELPLCRACGAAARTHAALAPTEEGPAALLRLARLLARILAGRGLTLGLARTTGVPVRRVTQFRTARRDPSKS
jgi:hypothetical protein